MAKNEASRIPADAIGLYVEKQGPLAEDVERVRKLLANAPADRTWRRPGLSGHVPCPPQQAAADAGASRDRLRWDTKDSQPGQAS